METKTIVGVIAAFTVGVVAGIFIPPVLKATRDANKRIVDEAIVIEAKRQLAESGK